MTSENIETIKQRSSAYPATDLSSAIDAIDIIKKEFSLEPFSREGAAKALGYGSVNGASAVKIAALVHFGLLDREADIYRVSKLGDEITQPNENKNVLLNQAIKTPKLYNALIEKFKGRSVPNSLYSILSDSYNINPSVSQEVAKNFKSSLEFAGLIVNDVIVDKPLIVENKQLEFDFKSDDQSINNKTEIIRNSIDSKKITLILPSGLEISFPEHLIERFLNGEFAEHILKLNEI